MKLHKIKIKGFRKLKDVTIVLSDATYLIGENNVGKSSALRAIELLLTNNKPCDQDYSTSINIETEEIIKSEEVILEGTFINLPPEADEWVGYKGRIFEEDGIRKIKYKKTFTSTDVKYEMWQQDRFLLDDFKDGNKVTIKSLISGDISEKIIRDRLLNISDDANLNTKTNLKKLDSFSVIWDYKDTFEWINNPGGFPQNVISKFPKFILIPAEHKAKEINSDKKTALGEVMSTIFDDIVEKSENFENVKKYFSELETEIDTENKDTEFGKLMVKVNKTIKNVFPDSEILAKINLSDPSTFLKPSYDIKLGSNIMTDVEYQGTGMIRSTAFSLLKFREDWKKERDNDLRNLFVAFEEPELFLHPNAANQMRNTIYELAGTDNQILCTSHSPYMIDLSREKENQIINNLSIQEDSFVKSIPFSITEKFLELQESDRDYVKMLVKIDDYFSRAFFAKKIIIVEGDTEEIVLKKSVSVLSKDTQIRINSDFQFIKARGKATIPPLIKYFESLGITNYFVIHDRDKGTVKAEEVNPRILEAVGSENKRIMLEEDMENALGYNAPSRDKPIKAYQQIKDWKEITDIPEQWKNVLNIIFKDYIGV